MREQSVSWVLWWLGTHGASGKQRREALGQVDVLLRKSVRRAVMFAVVDAAEGDASGSTDEAYHHRLALVRRRIPEAWDWSPEKIEAAFAEQQVEKPKKHRATLLALAVALGLLGATAAGLWVAMAPAAALRDHGEATEAAWVQGGVPMRSAEAEELFVQLFPQYLVQLDAMRRGQPSEVGELRDAMLGLAERVLSADGRSFLVAVLDQCEAQARGEGVAPEGFVGSVDALNRAIEEANEGYFLDSELIGREQGSQVLFAVFRVNAIHYYEADGERVRSLRLERADRLNLARSMLGFTRPQIRDALVLEGRIEGYLGDVVLPALAPEGELELASGISTEELRELRRLATQVVRQEAVAVAGEEVLPLGAALAERQNILEQWATRFRGRIQLRVPRGIDFDPETYSALEGIVPRSEWRRFEGVQSRVEEEDVRLAYRRLEAAFSEAVELHEVQHRLDYRHGVGRIAPSVEAQTGALVVGGQQNRRAQRSQNEYSAYLSELARAQGTTQTQLLLFGLHLYERRGWGRPESYAAVAVFQGLAKELQLEHEPLVRSRRINRSGLAKLHTEILGIEAERLQAAARALWETEQGRALEEVAAVPRSVAEGD